MVQRWKFTDLTGVLPAYVFPRNPNEMSSPEPIRGVTAEHTSSGLEGQPLVWEGAEQLSTWTFSGQAWYEQEWKDLNKWVYKTRGRVLIEDHLGRFLTVVLTRLESSFDPGIRVVNGQKSPFYGRYTVTGLVLKVEGF